MNSVKTLVTSLLMVLAGVAYILLCYWAAQLRALVEHVPTALFLAALFLLLVTARASIARWPFTAPRRFTPLFLLGVALGVLLDVHLDQTMERNLFPIELAWWLLFCWVALTLGGAFDTRLLSRKGLPGARDMEGS